MIASELRAARAFSDLLPSTARLSPIHRVGLMESKPAVVVGCRAAAAPLGGGAADSSPCRETSSRTSSNGVQRMVADAWGRSMTKANSFIPKHRVTSRSPARSCQGGCRGFDPRFPLHTSLRAPAGFRPSGSSAPALCSSGARLLPFGRLRAPRAQLGSRRVRRDSFPDSGGRSATDSGAYRPAPYT